MKTPQVAALPGMTPLGIKSAQRPTTYNQQALAEAIARLRDGIARLEACKLDDMVLAWSYGLGVKINGNAPSAVSLENATPITGPAPTITNGAGERAVLMRRQDAIARANADTLACIARLQVLK